MMSWLKMAALWTGVAAGAAAATVLAVPDLRHMIIGGEGISGFTKSAYDEQGNPLSGPVAVGQTIQYVLRYKPPVSGSSGPVTIVDTLSPNQTYVPGTIVAPGWTPSTPEYNLNQETYSSPGFGPGSSFALTVPAISGSAGAPGGGGDGYEPVPVVTSTGTKVFGVNHHQAFNGKIMCWYGADLSKCAPAYPKRASTSPEQRATPDLPHAAVFDKKVYFPAARYDEVAKTTLEFGMGCWDAETDSECPFVSLPGQPSVNMLGNTTPYLGNSGTNSTAMSPASGPIRRTRRIYSSMRWTRFIASMSRFPARRPVRAGLSRQFRPPRPSAGRATCSWRRMERGFSFRIRFRASFA